MSEIDVAAIAAKDALISPCGKYRYWLTRRWADGPALLPIVMLNPSTADAAVDDPTIRRCMSFARREGFGGVFVINLFAFRATSPDDMRASADPVGPDNDYWTIRVLKGARAINIPILAAWGAHGDHRSRANYVRGMANMHGARLTCLGTTKQGHPRHPLYVKGDQPLTHLHQGHDNDRG